MARRAFRVTGMAKGISLAIAAGAASGMVYISVLSGGALGVLLSYVTPLPLVMAGLAYGFGRAAIGAGVALAMVALFATETVPVFAVVALLPVVALVRQALLWRVLPDGRLEWFPPGRLLAQLAVLAVGLMGLGAALLLTRHPSGLEESVRHLVTRFFDQMAPTVEGEVRDRAVALWSALFPGMLAGAWLLTAVVNGVVGQWMVTRAGHALRPTPAYAAIVLPAWLLAGLAVAVTVGSLAGGDAGYLGRNAALVLIWPYVFLGLAVVHGWLRGKPNAGLSLALFYLAFFAMFGWALVAVAGLGLVRQCTRLRRRPAEGGQEDK